MTEVVAITVESLERLNDMDGWLTKHAKGTVQVFWGHTPRQVCVATYNVAGGTKLWAEPRPITAGDELRFHFEKASEASYFKLAYG